MNNNEKTIVGMIFERLANGDMFVGGLFNLLHLSTQKKLQELSGYQFAYGLSTDTGKHKAIQACKEMMGE